MLTGVPERNSRILGPNVPGLITLLILAAIQVPAPGSAAEVTILGQPGFVVLEAARGPAAGFAWVVGPGPGFRTLVWPEGRLVIPDSVTVEDIGRTDLGFPCSRLMAGSGRSGQLILKDGIFPVSETIVLVDGPVQLQLEAGELEISGAMIRYRRPAAVPREFRSGLLLLAGMVLMIIVLLRRARLKSGERQEM